MFIGVLFVLEFNSGGKGLEIEKIYCVCRLLRGYGIWKVCRGSVWVVVVFSSFIIYICIWNKRLFNCNIRWIYEYYNFVNNWILCSRILKLWFFLYNNVIKMYFY